jgi:hypothetical protein
MESVEQIMAAFRRDVPDGPSQLRAGRISLEAIEKILDLVCEHRQRF